MFFNPLTDYLHSEESVTVLNYCALRLRSGNAGSFLFTKLKETINVSKKLTAVSIVFHKN